MKSFRWLLATVPATLFSIALHAQVTLHDDRVFPESITSTEDGALFIGSMAKGEVLRAEKGAKTAEVWIKPGTAGIQSVFGVLADGASNTLWVCSSGLTPTAAPTAIKTFDLMTGVLKGSYDFPGKHGLCNDIAIGEDATAYITDTMGNRILRLKKGALALEVWAEDPKLAGVDGIAFSGKDSIYINTYFTGHIIRVPVLKNGESGDLTEIKLPEVLKGPDGMRAIRGGDLLLVEGQAGRLDRITVHGDSATVELVKDQLSGVTAVTQVGDTAWVNDGKLNLMREPAKEAGQFLLYAVQLKK